MIGASPIESSSIRSTAGSVASARAIESICCSPPDSVPAVCLRRSPKRGNCVNTRSCTSWKFVPVNVAMRRFSITVRFGKMPRPPG